MADDLLNLEELLAPIEGDNPCGETLRWDPVWSEIQQKRKPKIDNLGQHPDEPPDWIFVVRQTSNQLATRSKDLQLAVWLIEALTITEKFPGFQAGLAMLLALIRRYWDDGLYPLVDGGDLEQRLAPLHWLTDESSGGRIPTTLKQTAVISLGDDDEEDLSFLFWEGRRASPRSSHEEEDVYQRRTAEAERKRTVFDQAAAAASIAELTEQRNCLTACLELVKALDAELTERCGNESPSFSHIQSAVQSAYDLVGNLLKARGGPLDDGDVANETATDDGSGGRSSNSSARSRQEAVQHLSQAAAYFSTSEPHSPVGYLIKRAIRWANLPFEELLAELLKDGQHLDQVKDVLGLKPSSGDSQSE